VIYAALSYGELVQSLRAQVKELEAEVEAEKQSRRKQLYDKAKRALVVHSED
jgi:uncharacterized OsmC-like protein